MTLQVQKVALVTLPVSDVASDLLNCLKQNAGRSTLQVADYSLLRHEHCVTQCHLQGGVEVLPHLVPTNLFEGNLPWRNQEKGLHNLHT